jgi:hypothetical protein
MNRVSVLGCAVAALVFGALSGSAMANTVTGSIWENDSTGAGNAIPGNVPGTTPDVTFTTASPIDFQSGGAYTIGEFLQSGTGSTILTGASELGNSLDNTLFNFTGTVSVTTGEQFIAGHDDGLTLIIDGLTVISAPGPTSFNTTPAIYSGPSGNFAFQLVYGECCGAPGDLEITLPLTSGVPESATWAMMLLGAGLVGGGLRMARRKDDMALTAG